MSKIKMPVKMVLFHNWFMIKIIFQTSPLFGIMLIINGIRHRGFNFLEWTIGIAFVLDSVEFNRGFDRVLYFLLFILGLSAISGIFSGVYFGVIIPKSASKIERDLKLKLYEKAKDLDLSCYDDPYYYNEFVLAVAESSNAIDRTAQLLDMATQGIFMFIAYGTFFLIKDPVSVLFVFLSFITRLLFAGIISKLQFRVKLEQNPFVRKRSYVNRVFYLLDYAKELRLNKEVSKGLYQDFEETNKEISRIQKEVAKKKWGLSFLNDYIFRDFINDGLYLTYLVFKAVVQKAMSFSTMVVMYGAFNSLRRSMAALSELFPYAMETALYVEKIRMFLEYETKIVSSKNYPAVKKPSVIRFEDVSFSYKEDSDIVLSHINLTINPKEKVALVGYNGAGKTTLIKLLMRLYDPTEGRITMDGVDIRDYRVNEYRERIGAIFQDYRIYAATVEENVLMDLSTADVSDMEKLDLSLRCGGFEDTLKKLDHGVQTQLTREFDESGTNLSGGESQKLATSRLFYKDCDTTVLDEPSSALDPIAEYQLNHSMTESAREKSVIFISHRLSTTKDADRIYMLEKGHVIEEGTHEHLLALKGKYAEMWKAQASKYVETNE